MQQPMPTLQTASLAGAYVPPADIGGGGFPSTTTASPAFGNSVASQDLPSLTNGTQTMPAQPQMTSVEVAAVSPALATPSSDLGTIDPVESGGQYVHTIASGESLYTIARRYNVTAQAIVQANGFSSPDKIFVGQRIVIPGVTANSQVALVEEQPTAAPVPNAPPAMTETAAINDPTLLESDASPAVALQQPAPAQVAATQEPQMSGADKFRWPVSGRVITDFSGTKGTGINIEAPEGTAIRAAENGTVIYVGSGVEGYGNLVLIRHGNGFVSAYAHLRDISVTKGQAVTRGDNIGAAGMTGSVSRPQLHFELRKGATPVDPIPLLAS
jgi:murein DD-endopeptidase MepM/ murein hydrolase activator NlpD